MSSHSQASSSVPLDDNNPVYGQPTGFTTGFALAYPTSSTSRASKQTVYAQSLLSAGNGIPLFDPFYRTQSEVPGVVVGDVGWVDYMGKFRTLLNIFRPRNRSSPKNFNAIQPPLSEWRLEKKPSFFPPNTVLKSHGIEAMSEPGSSLITFNTTVTHGAILCLPEGADRTDLVDVDALRSYVAEHALDWYRFANGYSRDDDELNLPNGSLFLVTGADNAPKWSAIVFDGAGNQKQVGEYDPVNHRMFPRPSIASAMTSQVNVQTPATLGVCFVRGFAIGLGSALWTHYSCPVDPKYESRFFLRFAPTIAKADPQSRPSWHATISTWFRKRNQTHTPTDNRPVNIFALILQVMLAKAPSADVLMVHDSIFAASEKFDFFYPNILDKLTQIFHHYDVVIEDGAAWMVPTSSPPTESSETQGPSKGFWRLVNPFSHTSSRRISQARDDLWKAIRHHELQ